MPEKKPRIFVCSELLNSFYDASWKMDKYISLIDNTFCEPIFMYIYALFEGTLSYSLTHYLTSFPEKISNDKLKIDKDLLIHSISTENALTDVIETTIRRLSSQNMSEFIKDYLEVLTITVDLDFEAIDKITVARNTLTHNIMSQNVITQKDKKDRVNKAIKYSTYLQNLLDKILNAIKAKYAKYTKEKILRDLWSYTFETPLLPFDAIWDLSSDSLHIRNIEEVKSHIEAVSGSERFYLAFWFQQYSTTLNDLFFKFKDMSMLVSISDQEQLHFLIKAFEKYPHLINGDFNKRYSFMGKEERLPSK